MSYSYLDILSDFIWFHWIYPDFLRFPELLFLTPPFPQRSFSSGNSSERVIFPPFTHSGIFSLRIPPPEGSLRYFDSFPISIRIFFLFWWFPFSLWPMWVLPALTPFLPPLISFFFLCAEYGGFLFLRKPPPPWNQFSFSWFFVLPTVIFVFLESFHLPLLVSASRILPNDSEQLRSFS